jgi:hypothetical protein
MYGATAPFTQQLLNSNASGSAFPPDDWMAIAKAYLGPRDYLLWKTSCTEICKEQATHNTAHGIPITADMLLGKENQIGLQNQLNYSPLTYDQTGITATRVWTELPTKGDKTNEIIKILQGPGEPFQDFVAQLLHHMGGTVGDPEWGNILVKQLASENANKHCKDALRPYRKKASLQDMIQLCSDIREGYVQGMALEATLKETLHPSKAGLCYNCKKPGHFDKECHKAKKANSPSAGYFGQGQKPLGICPHCKRGHYWVYMCHSQSDIEGQPLQRQQKNS